MLFKRTDTENISPITYTSHLQQQQLIELIRESRVEDAIRFASEQLAERGEEDPAVLEELERTLALLAFEDPHQSPFSDLLSHSHRQKVIIYHCFEAKITYIPTLLTMIDTN